MSHSDEEQLESLKRFWQDYGTPILAGASLALALFAGWRYWQNTRLETASQASNAYQAAMDAEQKLLANPSDKAASTELQKQSQKLVQDFDKTPYAVNAALLLARHASDVGNVKDAEKQLRWVLQQDIDDGLKSVATLRLARVLAGQGDSKAALALLAADTNPGFAPSREELRGDLLKASGDITGARTAYQAAVKVLQERKEPRQLLEVKMADVGLVAPEIKPASPILPEKGV